MFKMFSRFWDSGNERHSVRLPARDGETDTVRPIIERLNSPLPAQPTNPEDNRKLSNKFLSLVMSSIYAILLFVLGNIFSLGAVEPLISHIYLIFLCGIGFLYIIFLMFDINKYKSIALKNYTLKYLHDERVSEYFRQQEEESYDPSSEMANVYETSEMNRTSGIPPPALIPLKHEYCFSHGRHSENFYLKLGAACFAIGHLVHSVLLIAVQVSFIIDDDVHNDECLDISQVVLDVILPCYCFLQLYFIFKYSNVIILRAQGLAHFAFMHMIGSSLCFWVSTISRETQLALGIYARTVYGNGEYELNTTKKVDINPYHAKKTSRFIDLSTFYSENCVGSKAVSSIVENFSPYLYPFGVEFNILIVAIYYIIWSNIGNCPQAAADNNTVNSFVYDHTVCQSPTSNEVNDFTSTTSIVIHADCDASTRGLFAGIMLTVVVLGTLILGFALNTAGEDFHELGYLLNNCLKLGLHSVMLFAVVFVFNQLRKLDFNKHAVSMMDDVLLFICLPAFFLETVLSLVATINILNIVKSIDIIVMVIQVIIQTPLIIDGMRRCSNTMKLRRTKPGRELLMFLLIANVSMWFFHTFSYKSPKSLDERYEYYGKVLWTMLGHVSLPLIMFYRFHSSVCFADIWVSAYKPGSEH